MKIKQTIARIGLVTALFIGITVFVAPTTYAGEVNCAEQHNSQECCGGVQTSIIKCNVGASESATDNGVWELLFLVLQIMTAGVGILAVGGIAYGAALYASSGDKPEQAKQGKDFIRNVIIGLVAYGLMYVLLNFLIPGGIFSSGGSGGSNTPPPSNGPNRPV